MLERATGATATLSFNLSRGPTSGRDRQPLTAAVATSALKVTGSRPARSNIPTKLRLKSARSKDTLRQLPESATSRRTLSGTRASSISFPKFSFSNHFNTHRFFLSDTSLNQVVVIDAKTEARIGQIPVPGAFVGDISPDQSTIYIGTQVGDLYEIDPVAMAVKARIPAVQIGPRGFPTHEVRALADGRLALLSGEGAFLR